MKKLLVLSILFITSITFSQNNYDFIFSGDLRFRGIMDDRDLNKVSPSIFSVNSRLRIGVEKRLFEDVSFYAQIQDSRIWGEEVNTLTGTNNLDLHQGYVLVENLLNTPTKLQLGRFEISYGTERFLGKDDWHYVGRAFNGARLMLEAPIKVDLFALHLRQFYKYAVYGYDSDFSLSYHNYYLLGAWNSNKLNENHLLDLFSYFERDNRPFIEWLEEDTLSNVINARTGYYINRGTTGFTYQGTFNNLSTIAEAAIQHGHFRNVDKLDDILAYFASIKAFYKFGNFKIGTGVDLISGENRNTNKFTSFTLNFGSPHNFLGLMDYFNGSYQNLYNLGINDYYLILNYSLPDSVFNTSLIYHYLTPNKKQVYLNRWDDPDKIFGQELDFTANYSIYENLKLSVGLSLFIPDYMRGFGYSNYFEQDIATWGYLMISVAY